MTIILEDISPNNATVQQLVHGNMDMLELLDELGDNHAVAVAHDTVPHVNDRILLSSVEIINDVSAYIAQ